MRGEEDYGSGAEDEHLEHGSQEQSPYGDIPNLTEEEIKALQPKKTKVINPWIHEQTHKEYLENITVSELSKTAVVVSTAEFESLTVRGSRLLWCSLNKTEPWGVRWALVSANSPAC